MDKDRLDELKQYSIPTSEYWWFTGPEQAISKWFFKYWTLFIAGIFTVSTAIACLTNWWWILASSTLSFIFIKYWLVGWPALGLSLLFGYIYFRVRRTHQREERERETSDGKVRKGLEKLGQEEVM